MHPFLLVPLLSCVLAATTASAILSNDPGQRANRLVTAILVCSAWWSLCEVVWNVQDDPRIVLWLIKASSLAWLWLGPLCLDLLYELTGDSHSRLRRVLPVAYAGAAVSIVLYVATPWGLSEAVPTSWGWSYRFGPIFPALYGFTLLCVLLALASWPSLLTRSLPREKNQARLLLAAIATSLSVASLTDVVLPMMDVHVPRLGATSLLVMGWLVVWSVRRHGYLMMAPGAFASEILAALRDGVALLHPDGSIRRCNEGLARLTGRGVEELQGRPVEELLPELPRSQIASVEDVETELRPAQGEPVPVSVSSSLLRDADGSPLGAVLAIHELREVTALRSRLVTSGRLAAVGELAAGIAHEIGNPISFVRANLRQLRRHWQTLEEALEKAGVDTALEQVAREGQELLAEAAEGVERMAGIVRDVGSFSHAGGGRPEPADLNQLVDSAVGVAALSFSVVVERCFAALPPVPCDPQKLKQVFLNLLLNALHAVGDYGRIRLVTQDQGDWVSVRVEDDGPGIPEDAIDRVFDPFFTTRPAEGVGLGLAHCYEIVHAHGGNISVSSKSGQGATFEVRLPV